MDTSEKMIKHNWLSLTLSWFPNWSNNKKNCLNGEIWDLKYVLRCSACYILSRARLLVTPWTVAHQALLSMEFSRQEYWSGLKFPTPGNLPNAGIKSTSLVPPALAGGLFTTASSGKLLRNQRFSKWKVKGKKGQSSRTGGHPDVTLDVLYVLWALRAPVCAQTPLISRQERLLK